MKYSVITFGCRVNQADSLGFEADLLASGASPAPHQQADVVIVNTCSVTASADQGARQIIRRVARDNPSARIVVTGCYATRRPDEVRDLSGLVSVVANDDKPQLVSLLRGIRLETDFGSTTAERFGDGEGSCGATIAPGVAGRTAFTLRVQTGCAEPCAYCIIPTTRGAPRSVPLEAVVREVERISSAGFKEIALTGVHLGSYGSDLSPVSSLVALLETLSAAVLEPSVSRSGEGREDPIPQPVFRISSLEPMDCTREVVAMVAEHACFAPHFHLPLQHASNRVLGAMRRPYTIEQYASLVDDVRDRMPQAAIGSDVIVGFPGETDEDFEQLASYIEGSPITHAHVFPYSDRPGTAASSMAGKVPGPAIRERARIIRQISERLNRRFREAQVGTVHRALTLEDGSLALTGNYLKLRIPPGQPRNEWVTVKVTAAAPTMTGEVRSTT